MRLLFVLAAVLIALSPAAALAHGGAHEVSSRELQDGNARSLASVERHAWTPVCPPGSGHVCTCDNLSLSDAGAKLVLVVRCTVSFLPPRVVEALASAEAGTKPSSQFPPSLPRAPPLV